ncbi:MAG: alpha/beta hydrolase [Bdellovibrionota bacterium]
MSEPLNVVTLGSPDARPLILLHGWRQSLEALRPLGEFLANDFRVHLIDLPGFGQSPLPDEVWGTGDYAKRILRYLEEQKLSRAIFAGHSFGGKVSLFIAGSTPNKVERLILMDSSGVPARFSWKRRARIQWIKTLRFFLKPLQRKWNVPLYEKWFVPRYASSDYQTAGALRNTFVKVVNEDLTELLPKIEAPSLLLWGELDNETPVTSGQRMAELIPQAELVVLPGKDHFPYLGTGASVCAYHIKRFLKQGAQAQAVSQ